MKTYQTIAARFVLGSFIGPLAPGAFGDVNPHPVDQVYQSIMVYSAAAGNNNATMQVPQTVSKRIEPTHYNSRHLVPVGNTSNSTRTV